MTEFIINYATKIINPFLALASSNELFSSEDNVIMLTKGPPCDSGATGCRVITRGLVDVSGKSRLFHQLYQVQIGYGLRGVQNPTTLPLGQGKIWQKKIKSGVSWRICHFDTFRM